MPFYLCSMCTVELLSQNRAFNLPCKCEPCLFLCSWFPPGAVSLFGQMHGPSCGPGCAAEDYSQHPFWLPIWLNCQSSLKALISLLWGSIPLPFLQRNSAGCLLAKVTCKAVAEEGTHPSLFIINFFVRSLALMPWIWNEPHGNADRFWLKDVSGLEKVYESV